MTTVTPSIVDINKMTDEEKAALKKAATKQFAKFVITRIAIGVAIHVTVALVVKKLNAVEAAETAVEAITK